MEWFQLLAAWRKVVPKFYFSELCQSISLDLPETDRLSELLLSSFQVSFSVVEARYSSFHFL